MTAKASGTCRNGGCQRLATVVVIIPGLGERALCWHCHQAIRPLFGHLRIVRPDWLPTPGGAA